ncbi:hypothetical protein [Vibrio sp. LaRot3]|uniref:hypothetical protein n=1 Tax=Vibrio sp. LaRot3 TaxID=2998829 RepID=UPI0022CDC720|nr:hypothetical protein [Vibrio sp. LaRot3]MDA0149118.1 hypothetical protein [Vibrio sp. LaRot3]
MKKTLIAATLLGSLVMTGCSSSDKANNVNTDATPDRLPPVWSGPVIPEADLPIEGEDPNFGIPAAPVQPPIIDEENTPDRLPPTWGGVDQEVDPDFGLPTDMVPERPQPDMGEDMPTWGGECGSPDDGANCGPLPPKPPVDPSEIPAINAEQINKQSIRDAVRQRLNK